MSTIINATPHQLDVRRADGAIEHIAPAGAPIRCVEQREPAGELAGVSLSRARYGAVEGLAEYVTQLLGGDALVCSALAANAIAAALARGELAELPDGLRVCCPGPALRDADGRVIGCDGLTVVAEVERRSPLLRRLLA